VSSGANRIFIDYDNTAHAADIQVSSQAALHSFSYS
jgi:hypothetical protein